MNHDALDSLVTRLYRAARSMTDPGWQELLKNAAISLYSAFSLSPLDSARGERGADSSDRAALVAAVALTDTVLVLADHAHHLDPALTAALRQGLREALGGRPPPDREAGDPREALR